MTVRRVDRALVGRERGTAAGGIEIVVKRKRQHILARALILHEGREGPAVLLAQNVEKSHAFLPGGHVDSGEGLTQAAVRELDEELGVSVRVVAYLGAVEHQWPEEQPRHYEVNHVFLADLAESPVELQSREAHLRFFWCPVPALTERNLQPWPLRALIARHVAGDRRVWWASTLSGAELS